MTGASDDIGDRTTGDAVGRWALAEELIAAAAAGGRALDGVLRTRGARACAEVLLGEIRDRLRRVTPPADGTRLRVSLHHGEERVGEVLRFGPAGVRPGPAAEVADAEVAWDVVELAALLYGNLDPRAAHGWDFDPRWVDEVRAGVDRVRAGELPAAAVAGDFDARVRAVAAAAHALRAAVAPTGTSLEDLAVRFGSDKWGHHHWYARHYDRHFRPFREQPVRVLEIGIGGYADPDSGGASLRMWEQYFRRGLVFGLDVHDKRGLDTARVRTLRGDQGDAATLAAIAAEHGPFDIVIDDGSHRNEHVLTSFGALFPHVREEGLYVVEDLQTSYWPAYGGDPVDRASPSTAAGFFKSLVDELNHREWANDPEHSSSYAARHVTSLTFYHNIVFVTKGTNGENGWPRWAREPLRDGLG
ncbi:class I SAM-dependent methyltransferase [Saccharothrix australiensis]|uniref:Methyltransferase MycE N-terminal domain-containing protein n=1 Tax=Saccharothrix australiensis TaxID=2072 RepID=A0A495W1R5_9PSEU|nr:class I SAM-dependent methyltransferase [Saccharothrix australiensis]RKT55631.1 hypothetical protein C8E97_4312 [Saccharothrix australiensis]